MERGSMCWRACHIGIPSMPIKSSSASTIHLFQLHRCHQMRSVVFATGDETACLQSSQKTRKMTFIFSPPQVHKMHLMKIISGQMNPLTVCIILQACASAAQTIRHVCAVILAAHILFTDIFIYLLMFSMQSWFAQNSMM